MAATDEILQERLPIAPWLEPRGLRLPGTAPIAMADWLVRDEVYGAQMALRDRLIAERPEAVHATMEAAVAAVAELRDLVLAHLAGVPGHVPEAGGLRRPDGVCVPLDGPPLLVAGRLVQEDLLVLQKPPGATEHVLTAAILCFPSNWTLAEKIGRPLGRIHLPVDRYDAQVARRVQRLFDGIRPETPLMRANLILNAAPGLFSPRREFARDEPGPGGARFVRVERQVLLRLPASRAVVFSIHTWKVAPEALTPAQRAGLEAVRPGMLPACEPAAG